MTAPEHGLPAPSRRTGAVLAALSAAVVVALGLAVDQAWAPLLRLDAAVEDAVHAWALASPWAVDASLLLARAGSLDVAFWVATATVVLLLVLRRWRGALALALLATLAPLVTDQIKVVVGRARPVWEDPLAVEATYSYPSGHATAGIAVYAACGVALGALVRDRRWAWVLAGVLGAFGVAIGLSRVVLGVHWPSDVVGGWCVALALGTGLAAVLLRPAGPPTGTSSSRPREGR